MGAGQGGGASASSNLWGQVQPWHTASSGQAQGGVIGGVLPPPPPTSRQRPCLASIVSAICHNAAVCCLHGAPSQGPGGASGQAQVALPQPPLQGLPRCPCLCLCQVALVPPIKLLGQVVVLLAHCALPAEVKAGVGVPAQGPQRLQLPRAASATGVQPRPVGRLHSDSVIVCHSASHAVHSHAAIEREPPSIPVAQQGSREGGQACWRGRVCLCPPCPPLAAVLEVAVLPAVHSAAAAMHAGVREGSPARRAVLPQHQALPLLHPVPQLRSAIPPHWHIVPTQPPPALLHCCHCPRAAAQGQPALPVLAGAEEVVPGAHLPVAVSVIAEGRHAGSLAAGQQLAAQLAATGLQALPEAQLDLHPVKVWLSASSVQVDHIVAEVQVHLHASPVAGCARGASEQHLPHALCHVGGQVGARGAQGSCPRPAPPRQPAARQRRHALQLLAHNGALELHHIVPWQHSLAVAAEGVPVELDAPGGNEDQLRGSAAHELAGSLALALVQGAIAIAVKLGRVVVLPLVHHAIAAQVIGLGGAHGAAAGSQQL